MNTFNPIEFALASASDAIDLRGDYASLQAAIDSYRDNLSDTLNEHGVDHFGFEDAHRAYDAEIARLRCQMIVAARKVR